MLLIAWLDAGIPKIDPSLSFDHQGYIGIHDKQRRGVRGASTAPVSEKSCPATQVEPYQHA
jgi:hypothetical protein